MAPEQHEGQLLFETEVYSFGVILFELLSGTVPFSLKDNGESVRNTVMVSHLETLPPNLLSLRQQHLPHWWSKQKKEHEMQVPEWLVSMIYKCLEKKPADRFANGIELHDHIVRNSILAAGNVEWGAGRIAKLEQENERLVKEKDVLLQQLSAGEKLLTAENNLPESALYNTAPVKKIFFGIKNIVIILLLLVVAGFIVELTFIKKNRIPQKDKPRVVSLNIYTPNEEENLQLKKAREFLISGRVEEARLIYKALAIQEIPEAMYEYGNLTLLNDNDKTNCVEAMEYLKTAAGKGYAPAKRTVGLLYSFAGDSIALKQKGYQGCNFSFDIPRGSKLLMEATLQGDSIAGKLLDELNLKYGHN
jgi:hypothetical protein